MTILWNGLDDHRQHPRLQMLELEKLTITDMESFARALNGLLASSQRFFNLTLQNIKWEKIGNNIGLGTHAAGLISTGIRKLTRFSCCDCF
jgi:hypothetical protein